MQLTPFEAHALCLTIVSLDIVGRAIRLRWYTRGLGAELSFVDAVTATAWGDAAAGLTPLRFGGEAAKFAGLVRGGLRPATALLALGLEALVTYPLVFAFGAWLAWRFAPSWWDEVAPLLREASVSAWPWLLALVLAGAFGGWVYLRWKRSRAAEATPHPGVREALGQVPRWVIAAGVPLSLYNIVGRTMVLPLLAMTLPGHPAFGVMLLGSFALLYSQLLLPMPAGAGAVDFGFLAGMAGNLGSGSAGLLLAWRFYTVGLGAALGAALAVHAFGWAALRRLVRN